MVTEQRLNICIFQLFLTAYDTLYICKIMILKGSDSPLHYKYSNNLRKNCFEYRKIQISIDTGRII